jgi:hypothetical protein
MQHVCIAVADAARARLYTFDEIDGPGGCSECALSDDERSAYAGAIGGRR